MKRMLAAALCMIALLSPASRAAEKKTLAVMGFESTDGQAELGVAVSEIVRSEIAAMAGIPFVVVERAMLNAVMKEQELSLTGLVSDSKAAQIGRLLAAENLVMGKIVVLGNQYRVTARIVETETSVVKKEAFDVVTNTDDLPQAAKAVAYRLLGKEYKYTPAVREGAKKGTKRVETAGGTFTYSSVYTDARGMHAGGRIVLTYSGTGVTGYNEEPIGRAVMSGTISGDLLSGYYKASYGYGNYTFRVSADRTELVGDYYQVSNGAHGDWIAVKGEEFRLPKSLYTGKWNAGDVALVKWSGDAYWYPASIDAVKDDMYFVRYLDGDSEWRFEKYIRAEKLAKGDVVFGNFKGKGKYYRGRIAERDGDNIFIKYDDGDEERTVIGRLRIILQ